MEARNIPAFQIEDFMPPENELKFRVDFTYHEGDVEKEPEKFWKKYGKKLNERAEAFMGKRKAMQQAVAQIVSANGTPGIKLQTIYARVQPAHNTSYDLERTEQGQ